MTHTLIAFAMLLQSQDADPFVEIDDLLVDTIVYENFALTRVRVTLVNTNHEQERSAGLTLLAPDDAAVYEFDAYGGMSAERQVAIPAPDALATFMRMADRSRSREIGPVVFSTLKVGEIGKAVLDAMNQLSQAPNFSRAVVQFALSTEIEGTAKNSRGGAINVDSFSVKISGRYAASLLQQVGDGRYQLMTYPLHGGDAPVLEVYFAHYVERGDDGAYRLTLPFAVNADAQGHFAQERALAVYMQLTDAARNEAETPPNNPRTAEEVADHAEKQVEAFKAEVASSHASATGGVAKTTANRTVTITATKSGGTIHLEDTTTDGSITTRVRRPPAEPELLQQVGPGRFQLIMFPLPAGGKQTVEIYFASRARGVEGAYEWTTPIKLLTSAAIDKRLVHLRVVAGEVEDAKVTSHPKARRVPQKGDRTRVEFRISGDRDEPVRITYRAAGFAEWGEGPATDPLLQPKRALDALATLDRIRAWMTEHPDAPILAREEQATAWAVEAGLVTPYSSIVLSEARLYPHIGLKPPAKNEEPFKSVRHPR